MSKMKESYLYWEGEIDPIDSIILMDTFQAFQEDDEDNMIDFCFVDGQIILAKLGLWDCRTPLQKAVDLAHDIREAVPAMGVWLDTTTIEDNFGNNLVWLWISRESAEAWYWCKEVACITDRYQWNMMLKAAKIVHGF